VSDLAAALAVMVAVYEAHAQPEAAARLAGARDGVLSGSYDRAALHAMLSPRALPAAAVYPFDPPSRQVFYDAWDAALDLTR
jgi:hypothetical protein